MSQPRSPKSPKSRPILPVSPVKRVRAIPDKVQLHLYVAAGGRCQFPPCGEYLLEHRHTRKPGNFAQMAHIVAFSRNGPRADAGLPPRYVNDPSNLMLLCPQCHKEIDSRPQDWPVDRLKRAKEEQEDRIHHLTGLQDDLKTRVLVFKSKIGGRSTEIRFAQITAALDPRFPSDRKGVVIDLTQSSASGEELVQEAAREIRAKVKDLYTTGMDDKPVQHVSVFAMGTIPQLILLGRELSDKVETEFFQRHRDTDDWSWKTDSPDLSFRFRLVRRGTAPESVALVLSLSGSISVDALPAEFDASFSVYEITLLDVEPSTAFLRKKSDLIRFRDTYRAALSNINKNHPRLKKLHLFPAVPAPIALTCGNALLPKVDPALLVYDKLTDGFHCAATVNEP